MSIFKKGEVRTLSEWLEVATRRLADPAKERIRTEIKVHHAEAVARLTEDGLSNPAAEEEALVELGDAKAAAKRFRKSHLTKWEAGVVKTDLKRGRSVFCLLVNWILFTALTLSQLDRPANALIRSKHAVLFLVLEFLVLIAFPTAAFFIAKIGWGKPNIRLLLLVDSFSGPTPAWALACLFGPAFPEWLAAIFSLEAIALGLVSLKVWKKLGKVGDIWSEVPPAEAA
jgi:hypothetical protein